MEGRKWPEKDLGSLEQRGHPWWFPEVDLGDNGSRPSSIGVAIQLGFRPSTLHCIRDGELHRDENCDLRTLSRKACGLESSPAKREQGTKGKK